MFETKKITITQEQVDSYCSCVNDWNPIHSSNYNRPVVPGMLTTALMFEKPDPYWRLAKMEIRYSNPVYIGEEITYQYTLSNDKLKFRKYSIIAKQADLIVLEAECLLVKKL